VAVIVPSRAHEQANSIFMSTKAFVICLVATWPVAGQTVFNLTPTRAFGTPRLTPITTSNPNLIEGRELYAPYGVALDTSASPPIVYVADTFNDRVLAWKNSAGFANGDKADLVIGQTDLFSTLRGGPGTNLSSGLYLPVAVAVDAKGNLYVSDAGNNRIVRYPTPFAQNVTPVLANLAIGQPALGSGSSPNQGQGAPTASTLYLSGANGAIYNGGLAFDGLGNLWATDSGNNRVVRYNTGSLSAGGTVSADLVLGQPNFTSNSVATGSTPPRVNKGVLASPFGVAVSQSGDIYVSDRGARVLYFHGPISGNGQAANRILGVVVPTKNQPAPPAANGCPPSPPQPCEVTLGAQSGSTILPAYGLAAVGDKLFVADAFNNRVVEYDVPANWAAECAYNPSAVCSTGTQFSPTPIAYLGQGNGQSVKPNLGQREPSEITVANPYGLAAAGADLWVADTGNNRVFVYPGANTPAARVLGQYDFSMAAPNLIEGRELYTFAGLSKGSLNGGAGIAVDQLNHLYIADTINNRILAFADYRKVGVGTKADLVIGQRDLFHATPNSFGPDANTPTEKSLLAPAGVAVDVNGDLWVADFGNGRVLRFPQPFQQQFPPAANLVLGKSGFGVKAADQSDATQATMSGPYGIAVDKTGNVAVSDGTHNRVLVFSRPPGGDFSNTQQASEVIGQADFSSTGPGSGATNLNAPSGVAIDGAARLYVADTGNNRVQIFSIGNSTATLSVPAKTPYAVAVSQNTNEIWITDFTTLSVGGVSFPGRVLHFPVYEQLALNPTQALSILPESYPFALALDLFDNPIVADSFDRVVFFFPAAIYKNSASYSSVSLTPGMLALVARLGPGFVTSDYIASGTPWQTIVQDLQVTVNGVPAPIFGLIAAYSTIKVQIPQATPASGYADFVVLRPSTGQVLAAASFPMNVAAPAFYTMDQSGSGQIAAFNILHADGSAYPPQTLNGTNNPIEPGGWVQLYGTGIGPISGAPPDGQGASGPVSAPAMPIVYVGAQQSTVQYFGLVPTIPGMFAMNVQVPSGNIAPPPGPNKVGFFYQNIQSTWGPPGQNGQPTLLSTTINIQ
jgi:uncharacterized protein (TIGR03437 family)